MAAYKVNVGDAIPPFKIKDEEGYEIAPEDLIGSPLVLYFYPKDGTPGCTKQACSYRDQMEEFDGLDTLVIGISPDNSESHENFINKNELNFTLFSDHDLEMCRAFDVLREKDVEGKRVSTIERTTFVINDDGMIIWIERPVNVEGHVERVLGALREGIMVD